MGIESVNEKEGDEKEPEKIIVEIGCGESPFPLVGKRKLKKNETYIGIDIDSKNVKNTRIILEECKKLTYVNKFKVFEGMGEKTELPENYVDEIILTNVAGYRDTALKFGGIAKETKRILKIGGLVYIIETNTPYEKPKELIKFFENNGFVLQYFIKAEDGESFKKEIEKYMLESMIANDSYLIKFIKVVE